MRGPRARGGAAGARGGPGGAPGGSAPDSETTEGAPRTRRPRRGPPPASPSGAPRPPPDSTSWTPCSRGPSARPPLPALPRAAPLPPPLCARRRGRGRSSGPATPFTFVLFFAFGSEEIGVCGSALFMFLLGNKRRLRACVFLVGFFFKEMGRRRKKTPPPPLPSAALFFFFFFIPGFVVCCSAPSPHSCRSPWVRPVFCSQ